MRTNTGKIAGLWILASASVSQARLQLESGLHQISSPQEYWDSNWKLKVSSKQTVVSYFGVFDAYGDKYTDRVHHYLYHTIPTKLTKYYSRKTSPEEALRHAFIKTDIKWCTIPRKPKEDSASHASVAVIDQKAKMIYTANVGSSPIVVGYKNGETKLLSVLHDGTNPSEVERITKLEGKYEAGLFMGLTPWSRALGACDGKSKGQKHRHYYDYPIFSNPASIARWNKFLVSPIPDTNKVPLDENVVYLLIASDGVISAGSLDIAEVDRMIRAAMLRGKTADQTVQELTEAAKKKTEDDKTAFLVYFKWEEF